MARPVEKYLGTIGSADEVQVYLFSNPDPVSILLRPIDNTHPDFGGPVEIEIELNHVLKFVDNLLEITEGIA